MATASNSWGPRANVVTENPLSNMVVLEALSGLESELGAALADLTRLSRNQVGCLRYDCFQSEETSGRFMLVMQWQDERSLQAHLDSEHIVAFFLYTAKKLAPGFLEEDYRSFS